ncbi:MAG: amino acid ABC transporter permease [Propionibacteriaceae bacterium]|jgi:glutamate transport system permease protein|nr:amino acid ABC transporter permease [Propionibacteriaceae bacterium]
MSPKTSEHQLLFDAPGPKTKRLIRAANIVGGGLIAALVLALGLKLNAAGQLDAAKWTPALKAESWTAYFLPGLWHTLMAAAIAIVGAFVFGLVFGVGRLSQIAPLRWAAGAVSEFFRAVPVLLMMIFMWQFLGLVGAADPSFWAVVIALILYNGSVCADLIRSGVHNLPSGQHEAAAAIGLSRAQALTHVLVPQALLSMLPALIAQLVVALKDSALGQAIAYSELLREATLLGTPLNTLQTITVASVIFIALNYSLGKLGERLAKLMRGRGLQLDQEMAEAIPMNVSATGAQAMLVGPEPTVPYDESQRQQQAITGQPRHVQAIAPPPPGHGDDPF